MGEKTDAQSCRNISKQIDEPIEKILFITDNPKGKHHEHTLSPLHKPHHHYIGNWIAEARAAYDASCKSCIIKRPNNKIRGLDEVGDTIPIISSFNEIQFKWLCTALLLLNSLVPLKVSFPWKCPLSLLIGQMCHLLFGPSGWPLINF